MSKFVLKSDYKPCGDQPQAIDALTEGVLNGEAAQILLGVTGSGKTFTMANIIERVQRPTLVLAHNKTLAAQLCSEFREFFPDSMVGYFVSYYDYYQPEAYISSTDTYIEKDAAINDEIDRLRHSATAALTERRDVIIVASVSCIYSMGDPAVYTKSAISIREGMRLDREDFLIRLVEQQYERNDFDLKRGTFRVRGDAVDVFPSANENTIFRVEFFGDEIERIAHVDALTGNVKQYLSHEIIFPATHYATNRDNLDGAIAQIRQDLDMRVKELEDDGQPLEAYRLKQRTNYDIEMLMELGMCPGIENYSRYFDGRKPGEAPYTLLDYFPDDFLMFIDESHQTIPQIRAMFNGDYARKKNLIDYGFRLPSAFDNRPLRFDEFCSKQGQTVYVSATPAKYERELAGENVVEQIIRPTGLLDPEIIVKPATGQVDDLLGEINDVVAKGHKVLVTTLTKRMAENLSEYFEEIGIRVRYLHSDVDTLERMEIIRDLRLGEFDVLVGINLLREGLDIPEVALVAILDADKEGFLRSETSLIQTVGRAARNVDGRVVMYADNLTDSMRRAIDETNRRRAVQTEYNHIHGITPESIHKAVRDLLEITRKADDESVSGMSPEELQMALLHLEDEMLSAAANLDFEKAAKLRDKMLALKEGKDPDGEKRAKSRPGQKQQRGRRRSARR
jgi:excinuclease ABC subunit B